MEHGGWEHFSFSIIISGNISYTGCKHTLFARDWRIETEDSFVLYNGRVSSLLLL